MEIHITSKKLIKPSIPTPNHRRTLKLSCFDQLAPAAFGSFIFYYPANPNSSSENESKLTKLENSLSETLTRFYPLAGRYIEDENRIDCNDEGVEYVNTRIQGTLSGFLKRSWEPLVDQKLNGLIPFENELVGFCNKVLVVQVNMFDCGGLGIGVCLSHKVADGFVIFTFVQEWAKACKFGSEEVIFPNYDLGRILPEKEMNRFHIPVPEEEGAKMVTKKFLFNKDRICKLKDMVRVDGSSLKHYPSRVELVTAAIWKARIRVARLKIKFARPSLLTLSYNFRDKTSLKISTNAFGNVFKLILARFNPADTKFNLSSLVGLIKTAKNNTTIKCSKIDNSNDLFSSAINSMKEIHGSLQNQDADICVFTSVCRFPYYEIDFGWGKPAWVSSVEKPNDIVLMMDTKCGTGIEAWVSLEEKEMLIFQQELDGICINSKL